MRDTRTLRNVAITALLVWAGLLAGGCDDSPNASTEIARAAEARQRELDRLTARTTITKQQLLSSPRKTLRLGEFPVSLRAPADWALKSYGDGAGAIITVAGMATSGEIEITLVQQTSNVPADRLAALLAGAKKEVDAKPHPVNKVELRDVGPIKVLEQRMMSPEFVNGKLPPEEMKEMTIAGDDPRRAPPGTPTTRMIHNPHLVSWRFTLLIPDLTGKTYKTRGLTFGAIKLTEFEQDREFLEQLMASLAYEE